MDHSTRDAHCNRNILTEAFGRLDSPNNLIEGWDYTDEEDLKKSTIGQLPPDENSKSWQIGESMCEKFCFTVAEPK